MTSDDDLRRWLQEAASPTCRNCDGSGIFYGNVHICMCICEPAVAHERNRLLRRLKEPDEAMVAAAVTAAGEWWPNWKGNASSICRAIAAALAKPEGGDDG